MKFEYIIVQAGGKGTRLQYLTANKPKALLPIDNLPIIFHLFRKYPDKRFIIIGDYKYDVLCKYLTVFADLQYLTVDAGGKSGTCAGLSSALRLIPDSKSFMLVWCDLVLPELFAVPERFDDYIGISKGFPCRWKYEYGEFSEESSDNCGVAGLFVFTDKSKIANIPEEGEFVRWLQREHMIFSEIGLEYTQEFGLLEEYERQDLIRCRPFNHITEVDGKLHKQGIDEQGRKLAVREKAWYKLAQELGVKAIPQIYSFDPFIMEKIDGKNIFEYDLTRKQRIEILHKLTDVLRDVHCKGKVSIDYFSIQEAYVTKTFSRLDKIRDLVPFADQRHITINGKKCCNIFFFKDELAKRFASYECGEFRFIHGDCTFSNIMLRRGTNPVLIDPRGYFGFTENYGDVTYDWAKLYYSIIGNYDRFNLKKFRLTINEDCVDLEIESNGWEDVEDEFFKLTAVNKEDIKLIHAIIWLSLTTYAWEDYDSICGAFYNGLYYLEEVL